MMYYKERQKNKLIGINTISDGVNNFSFYQQYSGSTAPLHSKLFQTFAGSLLLPNSVTIAEVISLAFSHNDY